MDPHHHPAPPEPTIVRWTAAVPASATVLDVAAGSGRHTRWFAERGHAVTAVDRDAAALRALALPDVEVLEHDLEAAGWPFGERRFGAVVVVNYLWRPLLDALVAAVAPGGLLLYETFAVGNERFGRPRNPEFLLREGELRALASQHGLEELDFDHGEVGEPPRAMRQRLLGRRPVA